MNRRQFLWASAGAACALAAIPAAAAEFGPRLRVALIGCGPRGMALADMAIRAGCRITAAWDADPALAQVAATEYGAPSYSTIRELLEADPPDIAVVTGRVDAAGILELLQARAHLLLDRFPMVSAPDGAALRKVTVSSSSVVQVNLAKPGLGRCPEATALLQSGRVGPVSTIRAHVHHYNPSGLRVNRGTVLGCAGEILALRGKRPLRRVTATGNDQNQVITWEFDGLTAICEQRVFSGAPTEHVSTGATYYGTQGVLRVDEDTWRLECHGDARERSGKVSIHDRDAACWSEFLRAVHEQRQPRRSLEVALNAAEMVRLAECSLKLERPLEWNGRRSLVAGDPEANRLLRAAPEWMA